MTLKPRFTINLTLEELRQLRRLVSGASLPLGAQLTALDFCIVNAQSHPDNCPRENTSWAIPDRSEGGEAGGPAVRASDGDKDGFSIARPGSSSPRGTTSAPDDEAGVITGAEAEPESRRPYLSIVGGSA